jgi:hypothetical protein
LKTVFNPSWPTQTVIIFLKLILYNPFLLFIFSFSYSTLGWSYSVMGVDRFAGALRNTYYKGKQATFLVVLL